MMHRTACLLIAACALLSACASPPINYYTLLQPEGGGAGQAAAAPAASMAVQVLPVSIPAELDLAQILVRTGPGRVVPLDGERWAGPLDDQIRAALADQLSRRLGVPVMQSAMPADQRRLWRVQVEVRRFESEPDGAASLDAVWQAGPVDARAQAPLCRAQYRVPVAPGIPALVEGHQQNLASLAEAIAQAISSAGKQGLRCQ